MNSQKTRRSLVGIIAAAVAVVVALTVSATSASVTARGGSHVHGTGYGSGV